MKYVIKNTVIDAFQFDGDLMDSTGEYYVPNWAIEAFKKDEIVYNKDVPYELYIQQNENYVHVPVGYFIIKDKDSKLYPCEPKLFKTLFLTTEV